jgi:hypothetical protein
LKRTAALNAKKFMTRRKAALRLRGVFNNIVLHGALFDVILQPNMHTDS